MNYERADLPSLVSVINNLAAETESTFGRLTSSQLNWKPSADRWSVAQCFDHLLVTNRQYFPIIDSVLAGRKQTFWQSMPLVPGFGGKLLIRSLNPVTGRKVRAPKIFQPAQSDVNPAVLTDFVAQQATLIEKMKGTEHLDLEKIVISSPVTSVMTYSLMDAYRIIVVHEARHFQQAKRVTEEAAFPAPS